MSPARPTSFRPAWMPSPEQERKQRDAARPTAQERGYDSRWGKARKGYLAKHPLCVHCLGQGRVVPARVVDHVVPHKGDKVLFWDVGNWQSLCTPCHNRKTATEDGGFGHPLR